MKLLLSTVFLQSACYFGFKSARQPILAALLGDASSLSHEVYSYILLILPLIAALLSDLYLKRAQALRLGAALMVIGFASLELKALSFLGLLVLPLGFGLLNFNILAAIGGRFALDPAKRDSAFLSYFFIYCVGAGTGGFFETILAARLPTLGVPLVAALGMLVAFLLLIFGGKSPAVASEAKAHFPPSKEDNRLLAGFALLVLLSAAFYSSEGIGGRILPSEGLILEIGEMTLPLSGLTIVSPFLQLFLLPLLLWIWTKQKAQETEARQLLLKLKLSFVFAGSVMGLMTLASLVLSNEAAVLTWTALEGIGLGLAYFYFLPVAYGLVMRFGASFAATGMALIYALANLGSRLAFKIPLPVENVSPTLVFGALALLAGAIVYALTLNPRSQFPSNPIIT